MNWTLAVIIICVVIAIFTCWLELRRSNRVRLTWRIIASLIAVAALACIALPVSYHGETHLSGSNEAVLLTANYNADNLNHGGYKQVYTIDKEIKKSYPKAILLSSVQDLTTTIPQTKQLTILGDGLDGFDLEELGNIAVVYNAPPVPQGFLAANWPQQLKAGDLLQVQGKFNNTSAKPVKLLLKGLNTALDSLTAPAEKIADFELNTVPKITGRAAYTLNAIEGKDTLAKENIPVAVEAVKPVKVLMLSASPDFESKFLKDWLSQNGYAVAVRIDLTKNKLEQDFINTEKQPLDHLSAAVLNKFDVVIGDLSTLKGLPPVDGAALKQAVEQNGLGIIVRADSSGKAGSWLQNYFQVYSLSTKVQLAVPLQLQGQKNKTAPLNIDPSYITEHSNTQNLAFDSQNHIVASSTLNGAGKLVFTTLRNSYTWQLAGFDKDYSALWSLLISKAARKTIPVAAWTVASPLAVAGRPVVIQLESGSAPAKLAVNTQQVATLQDALVPYQWNATYWPENAGWQKTTTGSEPASWWYVYQKNNWISIQNLEKIEKTKHFADISTKKPSVTNQIQQLATIEVPKMYFYLILLAACTFLWTERKISA